MRVDVMSRTSSRLRAAAWTLVAVAAIAGGTAAGRAQGRPTTPSTTDPRATLKAGIKDAGTAAKNMTLVSSMGKPNGFFDPKNPAGDPTPAERPAGAAAPAPAPVPAPAPAPAAAAAAPRPGGGGLDFANSDLAFKGVNVVMGNFHGFNTYNVEDAKKPKLVASIACPGGQGDVSIYGNLLFMSVEQTRGHLLGILQVGDVEDAHAAEPLHAHRRGHALRATVDAAARLLDRHEQQVAVDRHVALAAGAGH